MFLCKELKYQTVTSGGVAHLIHWTMMTDGTFHFSPSQVMTADQYDVVSHYYQQDYDQYEEGDDTTPAPVTEAVVPYDPYDDVFSVSGYDLPAYGSEVYDTQNLSYNIVNY